MFRNQAEFHLFVRTRYRRSTYLAVIAFALWQGVSEADRFLTLQAGDRRIINATLGVRYTITIDVQACPQIPGPRYSRSRAPITHSLESSDWVLFFGTRGHPITFYSSRHA